MKRRTDLVIDALRTIADTLRAGQSLRQAVDRSAGIPGSPLAPVAAALARGLPLASALREQADETDDADLRSALCVLAVNAEAGGDPLPAVRSLGSHLARRAAAREEARALTTHARLGARAILLLTPAFLVLLVGADPRAGLRMLAEPRTRLAIVGGLVLQGLGALWISSIVRGVAGRESRWACVPFVRVFATVLAGKRRPTTDVDVADAAHLLAFALEAGLAPSAALAAVAPYGSGSFGVVIRDVCARIDVPTHEALAEALAPLDSSAADRFTRAYSTSSLLGVPLAPAMRTLGDELQEQEGVGLSEDVRRASVRVLVPLAVVVLPAFVLACLVPLFVSGLQGIAG